MVMQQICQLLMSKIYKIYLINLISSVGKILLLLFLVNMSVCKTRQVEIRTYHKDLLQNLIHGDHGVCLALSHMTGSQADTSKWRFILKYNTRSWYKVT